MHKLKSNLWQQEALLLLCINSDRTEVMCFNQNDVIASLNGKPLKSVYQFIYLGSNISSTDNNVNICIGKAWIAIDRLTTKWKSYLFNKISTIVWMHHRNFNKRWKLHKDATCCFEKILEVALYKTAYVRPLTSHLTKHL